MATFKYDIVDLVINAHDADEAECVLDDILMNFDLAEAYQICPHADNPTQDDFEEDE